MNLIEVKSSNISKVGYDPDSQTLGVQFLGGNIYHYFGVPAEVHQEMMATDSKGKFFAANIKPRFQAQKIDATAAVPPRYNPPGTTLQDLIAPARAPEAQVIVAPSTALAISFEAAPDVVGFPVLPFDQMVDNLRLRVDEYCAPMLTQVTQMANDALAMTITDAASYTAASERGTALKQHRLSIDKTLKAPKQSIDRVKKVFLDKEKELQSVIEVGEEHLSAACTAWRKQERDKAEAVAKAEQAQKQRDAEDARLRQVQTAQEAGSTALADKLLSTPVAVPKVQVQSEVPNNTTAKGKTFYRYRVIDINQVPREWLVLDDKAIAAHAKAKQYPDNTVVNGIEFYQEEDTNF